MQGAIQLLLIHFSFRSKTFAAALIKRLADCCAIFLRKSLCEAAKTIFNEPICSATKTLIASLMDRSVYAIANG